MANRKRQSTTTNMLDHRVIPCPISSHHREPESEENDLPSEDYIAKEAELTAIREGSPTPVEHECNDNSGDGDSSSDYVNNTSEEEDYDEGLPEEEEGITYYIRYCPEDDSYLEGMDCNGEEYVPHEEHQIETDECQEAVEEEWTEANIQHHDESEVTEGQDYQDNCVQILEDEVSSLEIQDQEENIQYGQNEESYQDYYPPEANGNTHGMSPYHSRKEDAELEEQEEDIDQIVAEIKMSMSMSSINSTTEMSPDHGGTENVQNDYKETCPKGDAGHSTNRHEGRPKSLNIPPSSKHVGDMPRGFKTKSRTPEDRQKWPQEQVCNGLEQPRKQQRSDLNGPIDNNNAPETKKVSSFPSFVDVPGPCEPEDLIDGIIFAANYLGSTQLLSERNPSKNIRMMQAQEAVSRVKRMQKAAKIKKKATSEGDSQALTEVDLFISTQRIKVLNADTQETMMDHALRTISYIADIGNIVVLMARRRMPRSASQDCIETTPGAQEGKKQYKMICHVFESEDAQLIAQSIGQAFSVAYQEFLRANGINPEDLSQKEYSDIINTQEMYNDDLIHFSNSENCKELQLEKQKGEILGVVIVESGWGSILPTVILANMMNGGPAARSGKLSIGDQIMSINGTSLVGLPLATCQGIIKGLKNQTQVKLNIVSCPPVTTVLIKRPDLKYQLGFSVQNGIICSLMRGGIAERGGVRVGHRIIEINGQSVVATAHEKIVQALSNSVGEIHMKTMPAAMFRLLTGQETPLYI
ncbi:amyloid-beta A4 precursor protein-binding family A member 2 isoform X1 [Chelonia mydas]|uniref:amyloid-beta A4 precursor protein-binding family A member 2 isoform X1 n=1 Tax=Chelonia mydas TaxID=8469 RepID=UPI00042BCB3F|nr:amyloid-beta A4 precursor protein-binding family A member 2 isoform X1 [Chelonia mydas]XP_037766670.1 amyloid-beta A4 precursor protein-binding family A member 2 isoform X1 [Chelonia mydas]XP_037766671.1 amyloid-beta A4 precursor protein-binding family A member 2 isoform X1 [Chelonia mydas]XP_037766672.1 amyloid-beta A4 precursor protein-binding family A member 2 isoform X1 [Chelonia mydas]XP_043379362.1 amyloid-beta A4 precursor protein-binding family A member 2 isoform X1 [Chelonia mydas]